MLMRIHYWFNFILSLFHSLLKFRHVHAFRYDTFECVSFSDIHHQNGKNFPLYNVVTYFYRREREKKKNYCIGGEIVSYPCIKIVRDMFYNFVSCLFNYGVNTMYEYFIVLNVRVLVN